MSNLLELQMFGVLLVVIAGSQLFAQGVTVEQEWLCYLLREIHMGDWRR